MSILTQALSDILTKNMCLADERILLVYDRQSPLAFIVADAYLGVFKTLANATESIDFDTLSSEQVIGRMFSLPRESIVILVQSTNFRLSEFRIRLELFNKGLNCVEHNHLGYIPEEQFETFYDCLTYRGEFYREASGKIMAMIAQSEETIVEASNGSILRFGPMEPARANIGDYSHAKQRGSFFPIGEIFSEAIDLMNVSGTMMMEAFPDDQFQVIHTEPFPVRVEWGCIMRNESYPAGFLAILDKIAAGEWGEVWIREFGLGLNDAISRERRLADVNFHERLMGLHLSLGKKHPVYGKKLPKDQAQRYHIDVFPEVKRISIDGVVIFEEGRIVL